MDRWEYHALQILKRISKKEERAFNKINKEYEKVMDEIMLALSALYSKLDKGEGFTYADAQRFNDLKRFQARVYAQVTLLGSRNLKTIKNLLEESYDLSYSYMSYAIESELQILLDGATPNLVAILQQVWDNPIYGLFLPASMEKDRQLIVRDINGAIDKGLKNGDTYGGIAKNIREVFESSKRRSMTIARTETHRVRERANHESSINAHRQGVIMTKTWRNMDDERVRDTTRANHVDIDGQTVPVDEPFKAISGAVGMSPGSMGRAEEDINCRCYSSRRVSHLEQQVPKRAVKDTFEDWHVKKKRGVMA